jgi:hypothetical protein
VTINNINPDLAAPRVPIGSLQPYYKNARRRKTLDDVLESLQENGQYKSLTVNRGTHTGRPMEILAGNHTWIAAKDELGWTEIAAEIIDVDEERAAKINIVDNITGERGYFDNDVLAEQLDSLDSLVGTALDDADVARLIGESLGSEMGDVAEPDRDNGDGETVNLTRLQCGELNISLAADEYNMLRSYWRAWLDLHGTDYGLIRGLVEHAPKI